MKFLLTSGLHIYYLSFHLIVCVYIHYKLLTCRKLNFLFCAAKFFLTRSLALQCACYMLSFDSLKLTQHIEFPLIDSYPYLFFVNKKKKDPF